MFGGIRTRLLVLVIATVVPFTALIGVALLVQWKGDQALALQSALNEARRVADRIDDEIGNLENLLAGLSRAVSLDVADKVRNDALLRQVKSELPSYVSNVLLTSLDGNNMGTSFGSANVGRTYLGDRDFFQAIMAGKRFAMGMPIRGRTSGQWIVTVARAVEDRNGELAGPDHRRHPDRAVSGRIARQRTAARQRRAGCRCHRDRRGPQRRKWQLDRPVAGERRPVPASHGDGGGERSSRLAGRLRADHRLDDPAPARLARLGWPSYGACTREREAAPDLGRRGESDRASHRHGVSLGLRQPHHQAAAAIE